MLYAYTHTQHTLLKIEKKIGKAQAYIQQIASVNILDYGFTCFILCICDMWVLGEVEVNIFLSLIFGALMLGIHVFLEVGKQCYVQFINQEAVTYPWPLGY